MEDSVKKMQSESGEKDIIYSKTIKAGKRIYYLDVKKNFKDDLFLAVTESKKVQSGAQVAFEKHKIFLYQEDFEKFMRGMNEVMDYIKRSKTGELLSEDVFLEDKPQPQEEKDVERIKLDIDF